jgi:hypothetical protein
VGQQLMVFCLACCGVCVCTNDNGSGGWLKLNTGLERDV